MTNPYFSNYSPLPRDQLARAEALNAIFDAIIVGFDGIPSSVALTQDRLTYSIDSGVANAYALAPSVASVNYVAGARYSFIALNANTGTSTINVSGLGVKPVVRGDGTTLVANDILAGALVWVQYDGTEFQLMSIPNSANAASGASAAAAAGSASAAASSAAAASAAASVVTPAASTSQWAVAGGSANAQTGAFPTAVANLIDGLVLGFRAVATNTTTTPTFKADGTTARTITREGGQALLAGDIQINGEYFVRYNLANTRWEMFNPSGSLMTTVQRLTSGSGATYTPTNGRVRFIKVHGVAGGGGGGGATDNGGAVIGSSGAQTSFDGSNNTATGGTGGTQSGGVGGSGGAGGGTHSRGNGGGSGFSVAATAALTNPAPGQGGAGIFGTGANPTSLSSGAGSNGIVNTGAGGNGGNSGAGPTYLVSAGGGGAGEQFIVWLVAASYTYTIGSGGTGGVSSRNGGDGGSGVIIVEEFY